MRIHTCLAVMTLGWGLTLTPAADGLTTVALAQAGKPARQRSAAPGKGAAKPPSGPARRRPPGVRGMFEVAQELYEAGKFGEAAGAYDALLRKYPGHEPAMIQLAKSLYRIDRTRDAYVIFARINPQHLDPETSYEYGWSFYTNKAWEGALYAFQRVPRGHALYDLANYYGAICAIKLKKYEDAEDMLDKAVVLPDKLAKSRSLYIKHVQTLRLMQQKSELATDRQKERDALNPDKKPKTKDDPAAAKAPEGYTHKGSQTVSTAASVGYSVEHQFVDNHGYEQSTFDARVSRVELAGGPLLPIPYKVKDRQAAVGLQLRLTAEDRIATGQRQRVLIDETDDDLSRIESTDLGTTDTKAGKVYASPWIEAPLPEDTWVALAGEIQFLYPEFERGNRSGYRRGACRLNGTAAPVSWNGELYYNEILDAETKAIQTVVGGSAGISGELITKLTASATIGHDVYDYLIEELDQDGPDSVTSATGSLTQGLPWGTSITMLGGVEQQVNTIFHGIPVYGQVSADGVTMSAKASLAAAPVKWLSLDVSQLFQKTRWSLANPEAQDPFEQTVADYVERFTAGATLSLLF